MQSALTIYVNLAHMHIGRGKQGTTGRCWEKTWAFRPSSLNIKTSYVLQTYHILFLN